MNGSTLGWGCAALALCAIAGLLAGMWIGYGRGWKHGAEEAGWEQTDARWKGLAEKAARPAPVRPPVTEVTPRQGPGKHRHPGGPPQHAALPVAGYLPAPEPGPWNATITMPAPAQAPWDQQPDRILHVQGTLRAGEAARIKEALEPEPEPVIEPTAVLPGIPETDTAWTRRNCAELQEYIDRLIAQSEPALKEITK